MSLRPLILLSNLFHLTTYFHFFVLISFHLNYVQLPHHLYTLVGPMLTVLVLPHCSWNDFALILSNLLFS